MGRRIKQFITSTFSASLGANSDSDVVRGEESAIFKIIQCKNNFFLLLLNC